MLTPAYALTATERVLPSMALDFTTAVLDPRVTITRALNTATRVNSSKLIETVNANLPRFSYNPVTGASLGLLIEETRANLFLQSNDFATSWSKANGNPSITTDQAISPDGTQNADLFIPNTNTNFQLIFQSPTAAAGTYTCSVFGKKKDYDYLAIGSNSPGLAFSYFNLATGQVYSTGASHTASIENYGNGFYRCIVTVTTTGANSTFYTGISSTAGSVQSAGDGTSGSYLYGAQLEAGAFATSLISTTTTSLTRNADDMAMTGTNFSNWFTTSAGALGLKFISSATDTTGRFALLVAGVGGSMRFRIGTDIRFQETNGTGVVFDMGLGPVAANTVYSATGGWALNDFSGYVNGGVGATDTSGTPDATLNSLYVSGEVARGAFNGWVQTIRSWPYRVTNAELRAFSK